MIKFDEKMKRVYNQFSSTYSKKELITMILTRNNRIEKFKKDSNYWYDRFLVAENQKVKLQEEIVNNQHKTLEEIKNLKGGIKHGRRSNRSTD